MSETHFDTFASLYDEQMPEHIREFLLVKKTRLTVKTLNRFKVSKKAIGLDVGCGTGWYFKSISEHGYHMHGIDSSKALVRQARLNNQNNQNIQVANMLQLPFEPESFDFAYCINSLHHLVNDKELAAAFAQIHRVLKKNAILVVHELNAFLLFKLYLNYIFPLTNKIDKFGGENWIEPKKLFKQHLFQVKDIYYYTFFPHLIPGFLFDYFLRINSFMERVTLRKFGVHYMGILKKTDTVNA